MRFTTAVVVLSLAASTAGAQSFGGHLVQLNGSGGNGTPLVSGSTLRLIDDAYGSASSAFTKGTFSFTAASAWATGFRLHYAFTTEQGFGAGGDGIAFVMQSSSASALGVGGGSMGYEGIGNSISVAFRSFWDDVLIGQNGVFTAAAFGNSAAIGIAPGSDFYIDVALAYDGAGNLSTTYTPSNGSSTYTTSSAVDVSSLGSNVYVGFTAGTGAATQLGEVDNWTFTGLNQTTVTPEPGTITLMASGLFALVAVSRRRIGRRAV